MKFLLPVFYYCYSHLPSFSGSPASLGMIMPSFTEAFLELSSTFCDGRRELLFEHVLGSHQPSCHAPTTTVSTRQHREWLPWQLPTCPFRLAHFAMGNQSSQGVQRAEMGCGSQEAAPSAPAWSPLCRGPSAGPARSFCNRTGPPPGSFPK